MWIVIVSTFTLALSKYVDLPYLRHMCLITKKNRLLYVLSLNHAVFIDNCTNNNKFYSFIIFCSLINDAIFFQFLSPPINN